MTLTQILQKIKSAFYTKAETDTALNDKANDSDVVHKSGDETIGGDKKFLTGFYTDFNESSLYDTWRMNNENNIFRFFTLDKATHSQIRGFCYDVDNASLQPFVSDGNLGTSTNKWKTLNGINPGALSLPSNNSIDILSTLQSDGYTAPSDGYVRAIKNVKTECASTFGIRNETTGIEDRRITERLFIIGVMVPVQAGEKIIISDDWNSVSNATITYSASFYPCKGNV